MTDYNIALTESKALRSQTISQVNDETTLRILDKAKALIMHSLEGEKIALTKDIADYYESPVKTIESVLQNNRQELESDGFRIILGQELREFKRLTLKNKVSAKTPSLAVFTPRSVLRIGMLLRDSLVAREVRTALLDNNEKQVSSERINLEANIDAKYYQKKIDDIDAVADAYGRRFGKLYEQRYFHNQVKKHIPLLAGHEPEPEMFEKVSDGKAWLIPTQVASELGIKNKSGNPDPRKVNTMLRDLGYQTKTGDQWEGTEKAITAGLCERQNVSLTRTKTHKDQLKWSSDIVHILKEHLVK